MPSPEPSAETYDQFLAAMVEGPWATAGNPRGRVAEALRRLSHRAVASHEPDDAAAWTALADALERLLTGADPAVTTSRYDPDEVRNIDKPVIRPNSRGTHPLVGTANPVSPPLRVAVAGDQVIADVTYDARYEGLSGFVQGGFIAAAFDFVLGQAMALHGARGVTAGLNVKYLVVTPIGQPLRYEAWFERVEGRKAWVRSRLVKTADGTVTAEADGLFIAPRNPIYS